MTIDGVAAALSRDPAADQGVFASDARARAMAPAATGDAALPQLFLI
jgi:hypothetical protein